MTKKYLIIISLILSSCYTSKKLAKKGDKLYALNYKKEALKFYLASFQKNRKNDYAKEQASNCAQLVLDEISFDINSSSNNKDHKVVIALYQKTDSLQSIWKAAGLNTVQNSIAKSQFISSKKELLNTEYNTGVTYMNNENYSKALKSFHNVKKLDSNYLEVNHYIEECKTLPIYQEGIDAYNQEEYQLAYEKFTYLINNYGPVYECENYVKNSLIKGQKTICIISESQDSILSKALKEELSKQFINAGNPFINISDRDQLNLNDTTPKAFLSGYNYFLVYEIEIINYRKKNLKSSDNIAYKLINQNKLDPFNKYVNTSYDTIKYRTYTTSKHIDFTYNYSLISVETGEIVSIKNNNVNISDSIHYAVYNGDLKYIYPSYRPLMFGHRKKEFDQLFKNRQTIKSEKELINEALFIVSDDIVEEILNTL